MATKKPKVVEDQPEAVVETPKEPKNKSEVVAFAFDNEHADGCLCTLTFSDGTTATGHAPRTDDLADDQAKATNNALES